MGVRLCVAVFLLSSMLAACGDGVGDPQSVSDIYQRATAKAIIREADAQLAVATEVSKRQTERAPTATRTLTDTRTPTSTPTSTFTPSPTATPDRAMTAAAISAATATQVSIEATATQTARDSVIADRKAANTLREIDNDLNRQNLIRILLDWSPLVLIVVGVALVVGLIVVIVLLIVRRCGLVETTRGVTILLPIFPRDDPRILWQPPSPLLLGDHNVVDGGASADTFELITAKGQQTIWKNRTPRQIQAQRRAMLFLSHAIRVACDEHTEVVPTAPAMGMYPKTWGANVGALKPWLVTKQGRGGATRCTAPYGSLGALYGAVAKGDVQPTPLPPTIVGRQRPMPAPARP